MSSTPFTTAPAPLVRLTVIVSVRSAGLEIPIPDYLPKKALTERSVQSVLAQEDPIGVEVLAACSGSGASVADHLETIFGHEIATHRLKVARLPGLADPAALKNEAAQVARGHFLAFLDPGDWWRPARIRRLDPWLPGSDLILSVPPELHESTDWLRSFLSENWAIPGSLVVRRQLFDRIGGFPTGTAGNWLPRRLPGSDVYEFILRALMDLAESDSQSRLTVLGGEDVVAESVGVAGKLPGALATLERRARKIREKASLLHLLRNLPPRHRPLALRALIGRKKISG